MAYSQSLVSLYQNNFNVVNNISLISLYQTLKENQKILTEETIAKNNHFRMQPLDVEKFIKANNIQEVSNPVFFVRDGVPTADGLLSNEIFGITKDSRANIFAYIDLHGWFLHPLVYKKWSQMDNRIKEIVYGTKKFRISSNGDFIEDENGETGLEFLHKNINNIKIKSTESRKRDANIEFIEKYKSIIFTNKQIVIPAYYRDVDTRSSNIGVGILNKHYASLLIAVRSLKETADYGLDMSDSVRGRIQQGMLNIYNCICGTSGAETDGVGLAQKKGLVRNAVMTKTVDYGSRLVMSAPQLKVEHYEDMMADLDHSSLPLASVITNFKPFIVFNVKRFFENEFGGQETHAMIDANENVTYEKVKDPLVTFSEEEIEKQIKRFIYGFSNRFDPVKVPLENGKTTYMIFKGSLNPEVVAKGNTAGQPSIINRRLTWCDVFYMAAVESVKDKCILITRYPMDSCYNQFPSKVRVASTVETEPMYINGTFYRWYPKIREDDMNINTSNLFVDTMNISNLYLKAMSGDYDGDQISVKGVYTEEANEELRAYLDSKKNFIDLGGENMRVSSTEAVQSIYSLTKVLDQDKLKLTDPVF